MDYRVPENLRRQLAYAVRSIQWSYAIFWAISSRHQGMLKWGEGYYNGDIKTRKTVQAMEVNEDQLGLERSEQLRELYESLSAGESSSSPQSRRPSAALSPEDLTNTEWFYLVCMSFFFNIGQGLPGRTLANGQPIWLCNAHHADSRVFSRSLLAKSASVQTVACFPFPGGVIEIGVTEMVPEDLGLIQHIRTSFLDIPCPVPQISTYSKPNQISTYSKPNQEILDTNFDAIVECEDVKVCSPHSSSNRLGLAQQAEELFMADDLNEGASRVQSWQLMDDEVSCCDHNSMSSIGCISQTLVNCEKVREKENDNDGFLLHLQEDNQTKFTSMDLQADDIHYHAVVSALLKSSHQLILGPNFPKLHKSSFVRWKKGGFVGTQPPQSGAASQRLLKRVLFEVARMPGTCWVESREDYGGRGKLWRPQVDSVESSHALAERRRREKLNEKFVVLGSLVPSTSKADKASILDNAIEYVKELKRKVELDSFREPENQEARTKRKPQDITERTSDNYGNNSNSKRFLTNKHKPSNCILVEDEDNSTDNVTVNMAEKEVLIEITCPWREWLLLEIMNAISQLHLDPSSVQSTNIDGILSLTIKSKFKGSAVGSLRIIRQALQRAVDKC